jgi:hypothetical protein
MKINSIFRFQDSLFKIMKYGFDREPSKLVRLQSNIKDSKSIFYLIVGKSSSRGSRYIAGPPRKE